MRLAFAILINRNFSFDLAAFYNQYDHLLSLEPQAPFTEIDSGTPAVVYPFLNGNGVRGSTYGFEITPDWKPKPWWRLEAHYSWLRMDMRTIGGSRDTTTVGSLEGSSPHHQIRLQSYFDLARNLEFSATWRYVSALPFFPDRRLSDSGCKVCVAAAHVYRVRHYRAEPDATSSCGVRFRPGRPCRDQAERLGGHHVAKMNATRPAARILQTMVSRFRRV